MNWTYIAIMGSSIADALGVPVEFKSRDYLLNNKVTSYIGYGTHNQPSGTWSDDTSMTLCLMDSIIKRGGVDYYDIMDKFVLWKDHGKYTPFEQTFDIGNATYNALIRYQNGTKPLECGGTGIYDNGNGSLMRIMPILLYVYSKKKMIEEKQIVEYITGCSKLTHAHTISLASCLLYYGVVEQILESKSKTFFEVINRGIEQGRNLYIKNVCVDFPQEYNRIFNIEEFTHLPVECINSSGYVVDTLEAALWCSMNYSTYRDSVLAAVNLGDDTDTIASVTGGIAALYYGVDSIPREWIHGLQKRRYIEKLCQEFDKILCD